MIKEDHIFNLLNNIDNPCVAYDSVFKVIRAPKSILSTAKEEFDLEKESTFDLEDAVEEAFKD